MYTSTRVLTQLCARCTHTRTHYARTHTHTHTHTHAQTHTHTHTRTNTYDSVSLLLSLSPCLSVSVFVSVSLSFSQSLCVSVSLFLCLCLSLSLSHASRHWRVPSVRASSMQIDTAINKRKNRRRQSPPVRPTWLSADPISRTLVQSDTSHDSGGSVWGLPSH